MVVETAGVAGEGIAGGWCGGHEVVERHGDDGARSRHEAARVEAQGEVAGEVVHAGVAPLAQPAQAAGGVVGPEGGGRRKAAGGKAEAQGLGFHSVGLQEYLPGLWIFLVGHGR